MSLSVQRIHELWLEELQGLGAAPDHPTEPVKFLHSIQLPNRATIPRLVCRNGRWLLLSQERQRLQLLAGTLVRIRGMVQHHGEEQYCPWGTVNEYTATFSCGFAPELGPLETVTHDQLASETPETNCWVARHPLFLEPVPGDRFYSFDEFLVGSSKGVGDEAALIDILADDTANSNESGNESVERTECRQCPNATHGGQVQFSSNGCSRASGMPSEATTVAAQSRQAASVVVYTYGNMSEHSKLNEIVEAIGFLELRDGSQLSGCLDDRRDTADSDICTDIEQQLVVHAIRVESAARVRVETGDGSTMNQIAVSRVDEGNLADPYWRLQSFLNKFLFRDRDHLAASYLVYTLIGSRGPRPATRIVLQLSLPRDTDSIAAKRFARRLYRVLAMLNVCCQRLRVSVAALNGSSWTPHQRAGEDRLEPTVLQLPREAALVVDETYLESSGGSLNQTGVQNMRTLADVLGSGTIRYPYAYTEGLLFEVDWSIVLLTIGRGLVPQAMLHAAHTIKRVQLDASVLDADDAGLESNAHSLRDLLPVSDIVASREALACIRHRAWPTIPDDVASFIESDFVRLRQEARTRCLQNIDGPAAPDAEALDTMLRLAILESRARGEHQVSRERWEQIRAIEQERHQRVSGS